MAEKKPKKTKKRVAQAPDPSGKQLVIVESPAKAKTLNKYLGPDYVVMASVGHVRDLPDRNPKGVKDPVPGVDLKNGFKPSYGIVSRFGLIGLIPSMECCGIAAKNIKDIAGAMSVMTESDSRDLSMPAFGADLDIPRFDRVFETREHIRSCGVVKECVDMLENDESRAFSAAMARLAGRGLQIEKVHLKDFELAREVHNVIERRQI